MPDQITAMGMIVSGAPINENDKRVVILTREFGKISAFVRGARRPGNHLMAACSTFVFGTFSLIRSRNAYTLVNAEIKNYFREIVEDMDATYMAYYFAELAEHYAVENQDCSVTLNLLYASFKALLNPQIANNLVRYIYELKTLVINGEYPDFFRCRSCGREDDLSGFSVTLDGMVCTACSAGKPDIISICPSTLYTLQYIVCTEIGKLYSFTVTDEVLNELRMVVARCMHTYLDCKMKSLEVLEEIIG